MKKIQTLSVVFAAAFFALQGIASADLISGKVDAIAEGENALVVTTENPVTQTEETVNVAIDEATEFTGTAKEDLKEGDKVLVEAVTDESGAVKAEAVNAVQM